MKRLYCLSMLFVLLSIIGCGKDTTGDAMEQVQVDVPPADSPAVDQPVMENTAVSEAGTSIAEVDTITNDLEDTETEAELDNLDDFVNQI